MDLSELQTILAIDWKYGLMFIAAVIIIAVWIIQKFDFLVSKFGFTTERMRKDEQKEKDISELKKHSDRTDEKIDKIFEYVDEMRDDIKELTNQFNNMQKKIDEADKSKIGDRITQAYNFYRKKGQWTQMESWAFNNMITAYKAAGGDSWIDEVALPASKNWEIVDE